MSISVKNEKCNGCKLCILACPESNVIYFNPREKVIRIDPDRCKICRLCVETCPQKAIE